MIKVFIDTSVFIRFLTQDDPRKFKDCFKFFEKIELGKLRPYTANIVILEIHFVLTRLYKQSKTKVVSDIENLLALRNLTLIDKTDTTKALNLYKRQNIKFADCYIATQVPGTCHLVTYDEEFSKVKTISVKEPKDFI